MPESTCFKFNFNQRQPWKPK